MSSSRRPTALVTGASRGVGKRIALALAVRGYDVAITARTVHEGDARLPGSLSTTAAEIEARGARVVTVPLDLLDLDAIGAAVGRAIEGLDGHLDVLVNNAIYQGPGNQAMFLDTPPAELINRVTGNITSQLLITQHALRHMLNANGGGQVVNITSNASHEVPPAPVGRGGWALAYSVTKAGFHRMADMLAVEYGDRGIRAFNVNPGIVATEGLVASGNAEFLAFAQSPDVIGEAIADLIDDPDVPNGGYVQALDRAIGLGLVDDPKRTSYSSVQG